MSSVRITKSMLDQLEYDTKEMNLKTKVTSMNAGTLQLKSPTVMIVFNGSDLNAAAYHLSQSLKDPFLDNAVATLLVQESVSESFIPILQSKLKPYNNDIGKHAGFIQALETIKRLNARTIVASGVNMVTSVSPTLVYDLTHEHLGSNASGMVTFHTFRTAKEAIALSGKESLGFNNASIWHENHSCAYELVTGLSCTNFFINCYQTPLDPIKAYIDSDKSYVTIDKSYHYETLNVNGQKKNVVFPIGTIFAN